MNKRIFLIMTLLAFLSPFSCEDSSLFVDCDKCYSSISDSYSIELKITFDDENSYVPITIYKGSIDDGEVVYEDTASVAPYYTIPLDFGYRYSAVAKYLDNGRTIFAVDGKILKKKLDKGSCSEPCYVIQGDVLDVRLK